MLRRRSILNSPERVERLRAFADLLVEGNVLRRQRLDLIERIRPLFQKPVLLRGIQETVDEAAAAYPGHTVSVSFMDDLTNNQFVTNHPDAQGLAPWKETFCQFVVASGEPLQVTDSLTDLLVCRSPHASKVRSYSGVPLVIGSWAVGVLCIYSTTPREFWSTTDEAQLKEWAATVSRLLVIEMAQG